MKITKFQISEKEPMTIWIGQGKEEPFLLRANKIEYLHNKKGEFFDHHLMFYLQGTLVFKMWLPNSIKDKEYASINEALKKSHVRVIELEEK